MKFSTLFILLGFVAVGVVGLYFFFRGGVRYPDDIPAADRGRALVEQYFPCRSCHQPNNPLRAPMLEGLMGRQVTLTSGKVVVVDESYLRRALTDPNQEVVQGYQTIMPAYGELLQPGDLDLVIQYLMTLKSR